MAAELGGQAFGSSYEKLRQDEILLKLVGLGWVLLLILLWFGSKSTPASDSNAPQPNLIITEFMASNDSTLTDKDGHFSDWIEIYNGATTDVDLGGWYLTDDDQDLTKWQFPSITLPGNSHLVVFASGKDRALAGSELHTNFRLQSSQEYLALVKPDGSTFAWEYAPEYPLMFKDMPYPWVGALMRRRGILPNCAPQFADVSYGLDTDMNERYFTVPTPGMVNGSAPVDRGPILCSTGHAPALPTSGDAIAVTVKAQESLAPIADVTLHYRIMFGNTVAVPMFDDGGHGDGAAEDAVYGAIIPSSVHQPGELVRYYVTAVDQEGHLSRWPLFNNPTNSPKYLGTMTADLAVTSTLPTLYWFVADPSAAETDSGTRAAVFYDGILYDNVFVRPRGGGAGGGPIYKARNWPKKNFKFDFNQGYHFQLSPDQAPMEEINLNSTYSDKSYIRQLLAWATLGDAGVLSPTSFPVRLQQNGRFHSVGVFVEQPDERYLDRLGLDPSGALYKMDNALDSATEKVRKRTRLDESNDDLQALIDGLNLPEPARTNYLFDHVNVPAAINYLAANAIIHNNDHIITNYYLYRDTEGTGEWLILPWDMDLTFGRNNTKTQIGILNDTIWADDDPYSHPLVGSSGHKKAGGAWNRFIDALYDTPAIREMYLRRLRTLMDEVLQSPGTPTDELLCERRIDELVAQMEADVTLDAARWPSQWGTAQTFAEAVDILKTEYLVPRRIHLYETHGPGNGGIIPDRQSATVAVKFGAVEIDPTSGNQDEEYFSLVNPNDCAVDISGWTIIGNVEYIFRPGVVIPAGGTLYISPDVVAFRNRAISPRSGEGHLVQGNYDGQLSNTGGLLNLFNVEGELVASMGFFDLSSFSEPVTVTLF